MNLGQLIEEFRIEADDNADGQLFSDNEIRLWLNQAQKEAARRSHLLVDSDTTSICNVTVLANATRMAVDQKVIELVRVELPDYQGQVIRPVSVENMDLNMPGWKLHTGIPQCYVTGLNGRKYDLYPKPTVDTNLNLTVIRLPLADMELTSDEPDAMLGEQYHSKLVQWALYRAYSKHDVEVQDMERATRHRTAFEAEFGTEEQANAQLDKIRFNKTYQSNSGSW